MQIIFNKIPFKQVTTVDDGPLLIEERSRVIHHHDMRAIHYGNYSTPDSDLQPLSERIVLKLADCEIISMRMMDRLDPLTDRDYSTRKRLYLRHLRYWNDYIERHGITHFISMNMPHDIEDYILYRLCLEKGIKTYFFYQAVLPGVAFLLERCDNFAPEIKQEYDRIVSAERKEDINLDDDFQKHLDFQMGKLGDPEPFYMPIVRKELAQIQSSKYVVTRFLHKVQTFYQEFKDSKDIHLVVERFRELAIRYFKRRKILKLDRRLRQKYLTASMSPPLDVSYIYVALHFQPECTTCPMGGVFVDQYLLIDILSKSVPPSMKIYVKEHPVQRSIGRSVQFYDDILKLPNVVLVNPDISTFDLIRNSFAVATVTGTVGWESLFYDKPVLMFGEFFYKYAHGVFQIKDISSCRQALSQIESGLKPTNYSLRSLLLAIQRTCVRGYTIADQGALAAIPKEENAIKLAEALLKKLESQAC
jgi:hypothetical protein